jgi:hypothetical protein
LLDDGTSVLEGVDADDCTFLGLHTILFDLGGVEVDFRASSFCLHTFLSFLGGVGTTFGVSSFFFFGLFFFLLWPLFVFFVLLDEAIH